MTIRNVILRDATDDGVLGRFDPAAVASEMGEDADGGNYGLGVDFDVGGLLEDVREREANRGASARVESEGVSVTVESAIGDFVGAGDVAAAMPIEKFLFDECPLRVMANSAFAFVP